MSTPTDTTLPPLAGRQDVIRGIGTLPDAGGILAPITGVAWPTGTYDFSIPVSGDGSVDVVLRTSAATGAGLTSTATIVPTLSDGSTAKGAVSAAAAVFVNGTAQILSLVGLRGERFVRLRLTVPGAATVTFDLAEYSAGYASNGVSAVAGSAASAVQPVLMGASDANGNIAVLRTILNADGVGLAALPELLTAALMSVFNGTNYDRVRSGAAAVLAAFSSLGSLLVHKPGDWSQGNAPAAATQATTTKAAGAAGVRHICTSIAASLSTGATAQAVAAILVLRDGATGVGTILFTKQIILPVNGAWNVDLTDLNIVGSAATAMTLEFTAAGVAGSFESVSMTGHEAV